MSRTSNDLFLRDGTLYDGFCYVNQCWVMSGVVIPCGHLPEHSCDCTGKIWEGYSHASLLAKDKTQGQSPIWPAVMKELARMGI